MSHSPQSPANAVVRAYHARTKHRFDAYAEGPGQLDWDAQPQPFRHYAAAPRHDLPLSGDRFERPFGQLLTPPPAPVAVHEASVGALLELSLGLSAWKTWGPSRWALRCNPSSGNLHPVEAYLLTDGLDAPAPGLHHYDPEYHALESRARLATGSSARWLAIGLSSVMWREAWKYGERAFRYCQLDVGHAVAALAYSAALLGWELRPLEIAGAPLAHCLGIDRPDDFPPSRYGFTEAEEAELLLAVVAPGLAAPPALDGWLADAAWQGRPSTIDPAPGYRWPAIDQVAAATRTADPLPAAAPAATLPPLPPHPTPLGAAALIRQRRSGQRFDPRQSLPKAAFYRLLDATLPRPGAPWSGLAVPARIHLLLFVLRVDGLACGLYLLPRSPAGARDLPPALHPAGQGFADARPVADFDPQCPPHLGLIQLTTMGLQELQRLARALSCHQDIAATGAFSLGMVGEFTAASADSQGYRRLLREAGLIGQALYLEAEAAGMRGTGIGCFFDDPVHQLFGLADSTYQSVYHFTVGSPIVDARIETGPPYPQRNLP